MQNLIKAERVQEELKKAIAETLRTDPSGIEAASSLVRDLNVESLDFLDIDYRMEQAFGIKMARHFILEHVEELFGEGTAIDPDGRLTDKAIELLKLRYEGKEMPDLSGGLDTDEVPALITVQSMTDAIMAILDTLPDKCPACGASAWKTDDGTHIVCGACGAPGVFTGGDDLIRQWLEAVQQEKKLFA